MFPGKGVWEGWTYCNIIGFELTGKEVQTKFSINIYYKGIFYNEDNLNNKDK